MRRRPSPVSRIAIAEGEYAVGLRVEKPHCWANWCKTRRCPGIEIIMGEESYCPMRLDGTGRCWQENGRKRKGWLDLNTPPDG